MIYRNYGRTGIRVSALGFGGMRFAQPDDLETSAALVRAAYDAGVNYFDTAPGYGRSEEIFGAAFRTMLPRRPHQPFYVSTKSSKSTESDLRRDLETSLKRMGLEHVDFFHVWCVLSRAEYDERKQAGVLKTCEKFREEGLIRHIVLSAHMNGSDIRGVLRDYPFEGVLLGYSAMNHSFRDEGIRAAAELGRGVAVMNPLGGGVIPQHPDFFDFVRTRPEETVVEGALRFLLDDARIAVVLAGFGTQAHLDEALRAVEGYRPLAAAQRDRIRHGLRDAFDRMCTGCGYCEPCPAGLPIPKLMDAYNQSMLHGREDVMTRRLYWHWGIASKDPVLRGCTACGQCEERCTQKLPVIERIAALRAEADRAVLNEERPEFV